jgi:hypothetical protein
VVAAEDLLLVGQQFAVEADGRGRVPPLTGPGGDVGTGSQGVGVAGAEDLLQVGQQVLAEGQGDQPGRPAFVRSDGIGRKQPCILPRTAREGWVCGRCAGFIRSGGPAQALPCVVFMRWAST